MRTTLTLLAVTRMRSGLCAAGIDPQAGKWIRPVKEFGSLQSNDLLYPDRTPLSVFDQTQLTLLSARPQPPHVEDWTCDFVRDRPQRQGALRGAARAAFLERYAEQEAAPVVTHHVRSLILLPVSDFTAAFTFDPATRKLDARLLCPAVGLAAPVPVTDLRWRALGRVRYADTNGRPLSWAQLRADLGAERAYLALGLSREFEGRIWPLVIGIHLVPDFEVEVDWRNP
jgi:hypothetical protein